MSRDSRKTWNHRREDFTGAELKGYPSNRVGFLGVEGPHRGIVIAFAAFVVVFGVAYLFS